LMGISFEVEDIVIELLSDELVLLKALISNVEDGVFVGGLVVHVEDNMRFGDGDHGGDVARLGLDAVLADGDVHVSSIALEQLHGAEGGEVAH
jgi:hypothetical protein